MRSTTGCDGVELAVEQATSYFAAYRGLNMWTFSDLLLKPFLASQFIIPFLCAAPASAEDVVRITDSEVPADLSQGMSTFAGSHLPNSSVARCPIGTFVAGIQAFKSQPGFKNSIQNLRYSCKSATGGQASVIRKLDVYVPDTGNWEGYAATEALDGPVAGCPEGWFVVAIQGFKPMGLVPYQPDIKSALAALGYMCKSPTTGLEDGWKTDVNLRYDRHMDDFSGTFNLAHQASRCPENHYVVGIQGFTYQGDNGRRGTGLAALRYVCSSLN